MHNFKLIKKSKKSLARIGHLRTIHGSLETPFFMPVATQGVIKHIAIDEIKSIGYQIILANTYHLMLRPGEKYLKKIGGLHNFIGWDKAILTDSGGFQIFSLASNKRKADNGGKPADLVKLTNDGVKFKSYLDGKEFFLTPEKVFAIQKNIGVDIAVCLDECVALPAEREYLEKSLDLTSSWAKRTKVYYEKLHRKNKKLPLLFGVIQGGLDKELRLKSLRDLVALDLDGYNIGGLSVGETSEEMYQVLDWLTPQMPENHPRYLMGVGYPENIIEAVKRGVDMFDCVIPTREGRHGRLFSFKKSGLENSYQFLNITNAQYAKDKSPINGESRLPGLKKYSKAYLHYLFKIKEPLGMRLATLNNLEFYYDLMARIKKKIKDE
jgi:queuine tRNA-ribosyltransferase